LSQKNDIDDSDKISKTKQSKDTIPIIPRDTILTNFDNNEGSNRKLATTHRSRKTRYDDGKIFLTKSARRVRGSLNTTIAF
jgi:hypothetical protein